MRSRTSTNKQRIPVSSAGPLKHTTDDFWSLVWEQQCPLVVMLTTLVEQGRVKCRQYWPPVGESRLHGHLRVTTASQQLTDSFAFREITLVSEEVRAAGRGSKGGLTDMITDVNS